jgi:hypothetical protein
MKNLILLLLVLPLQLLAQKVDSLAINSANVTNDKLNTWYKNTYKLTNPEASLTSNVQEKSMNKHINSIKSAPDMFLYTPYLYSNRPFSTTANLTNTPYYNGYLDRTGGATVGQVLLAGGINYILDKAIAGNEKKSKKDK